MERRVQTAHEVYRDLFPPAKKGKKDDAHAAALSAFIDRYVGDGDGSARWERLQNWERWILAELAELRASDGYECGLEETAEAVAIGLGRRVDDELAQLARNYPD